MRATGLLGNLCKQRVPFLVEPSFQVELETAETTGTGLMASASFFVVQDCRRSRVSSVQSFCLCPYRVYLCAH